MKHLIFTSLLIGLIPSGSAADTCNFVSEYYPDVTIEIINGEYNSVGRGKILYKEKPVLDFETGISNGYGGQYYVIRKKNENPIKNICKSYTIARKSYEHTRKSYKKLGKSYENIVKSYIFI